MKLQLLIKGKIVKHTDILYLKTLRFCIYPANKCKLLACQTQRYARTFLKRLLAPVR